MPQKLYTAQADFFKALSHPARVQILELLRSGEHCVCEIVPALNMDQSNVSRHLAVLKKEGLLGSRKDGLKVIYWISDPQVYRMLDLCSETIRQIWQAKAEAVS